MGINESDLSRRDFMAKASKLGFGTAAMLYLASCGGGDKSDGTDSTDATSKPGGFTGGGEKLKIGVVGIFSGVGAFTGRIVNNSLDAAVTEINATGGIGGRKVEVVKRDTGTDAAAGVKAYQAFAADKDVVGVVWAGAGLAESLAQIERDNMPVVTVFNDLFSYDALYPKGKQRSVFQHAIPDKYNFDTLMKYAKEDRGYTRVGLMYDTLLSPNAKEFFTAAAKKHGITITGVESYQLNDADFGPQVRRLSSARGEALMVWGVAGDTAGLIKSIDKLGSGYVDTPTAKGAGWHPHILGSPGGTGEHTWADLAGSAAKSGTLTAWHMGGLVYLPSFAMRGWMKKHLNKTPTGAEEGPADGLYTILKGVEKAGSTDRGKVVSAIETMGKIKFSSLEFGYTATNHLSKTEDEMILITLERSTGAAKTDPAYQLGVEWKEVFAAGYVGPTHLVRPTLDANRRAHPDVVKELLDLGYGTQCTKHADGSLGKECKVH